MFKKLSKNSGQHSPNRLFWQSAGVIRAALCARLPHLMMLYPAALKASDEIKFVENSGQISPDQLFWQSAGAIRAAL